MEVSLSTASAKFAAAHLSNLQEVRTDGVAVLKTDYDKNYSNNIILFYHVVILEHFDYFK